MIKTTIIAKRMVVRFVSEIIFVGVEMSGSGLDAEVSWLEVFGSTVSVVGVSDVCVDISWLEAVDSEASVVEGAAVEVESMSGSYWCGDG